MFATDQHLFIGMHRTGTSWVCRVLEATFGPSQMPVQHTPLCEIPDKFKRGRLIVGIVCNPLEWYVSRWAYSRETTKDPGKRLGFCDYLDKHMGDPHGPIGKACEHFPQTDMRVGAYSWLYVAYFFPRAFDLLPGLTPTRLASMHDTEIGCHRMMRRERLCSDLPGIFGSAVIPYMNQWRNSVRRSRWQLYYDGDRGRDWLGRITKIDAAIFGIWGYSHD